MTVREHLHFVASIKGLKGDLLKKEVNYIISKINIKNELDKLSKHLSGGNKRKLSIGMAILG